MNTKLEDVLSELSTEYNIDAEIMDPIKNKYIKIN